MPRHDGHHDDHGPHESGKLITIPIVILAFFALTAGFANPTPLAGDALGVNLGEGVELLKKYVEPRYEPVALEPPVTPARAGEVARRHIVAQSPRKARAVKMPTRRGAVAPTPPEGSVCYFPKVKHAVPELGKILLSLGVVAVGYAAGDQLLPARSTSARPAPRRAHRAQHGSLDAGYPFLVNKYYLDILYENVIVRVVAHPISAKAAYWINQNVLDGTVDAVGEGGKRTGSGSTTTSTRRSSTVPSTVRARSRPKPVTGCRARSPARSTSTAHCIFGAAAVGAIVLVILNVG